MENREENAKKILIKYNQAHIAKWMEKACESTKQDIINQVFDIDFNELKDLYNKAQEKREKKCVEVKPMQVVSKNKIDEQLKNANIAKGEEILKKGQFAAVTMAGGQGTRLRT